MVSSCCGRVLSGPLALRLMSVPMMGIGIVGVRMSHRRVRMPVGMRLNRGIVRSVLVLVMIVMNMGMLVLSLMRAPPVRHGPTNGASVRSCWRSIPGTEVRLYRQLAAR